MIQQTRVLHRFIGRDGDAWRLYVAATSWKPMLLADRMDEHGSLFPVAKRDVASRCQLASARNFARATISPPQPFHGRTPEAARLRPSAASGRSPYGSMGLCRRHTTG